MTTRAEQREALAAGMGIKEGELVPSIGGMHSLPSRGEQRALMQLVEAGIEARMREIKAQALEAQAGGQETLKLVQANWGTLTDYMQHLECEAREFVVAPLEDKPAAGEGCKAQTKDGQHRAKTAVVSRLIKLRKDAADAVAAAFNLAGNKDLLNSKTFVAVKATQNNFGAVPPADSWDEMDQEESE